MQMKELKAILLQSMIEVAVYILVALHAHNCVWSLQLTTHALTNDLDSELISIHVDLAARSSLLHCVKVRGT